MGRPQYLMRTRTQHVTQAIAWEIAAILWMVVEAILSLGAGYQAHSLALTGFGMDSLIELVSAGILVWRFRIEARGADDHAVDRAEAKAARWAVGLLGLLLLYLIGGAFWALITRSTVRPSPLGIAVMIISGLLMVLFARQKQRLGVALQSTALQADAAESWTCVHGLGGIRRHTGCMGLRVDLDGPCGHSRHCLLGGPEKPGKRSKKCGKQRTRNLNRAALVPINRL